MLKKIICLCFIGYTFNGFANSQLERTVIAQGQLLTQYQQQITDLQYEVDQLRGQLGETTYLLKQTIDRQKMILQQIDNQTSSSNPVATAQNTNTLADFKSSGNDKTDYNNIIKFVLEGKESKNAIVAFQQFLKDYPKSSYRANVNYWLGQLTYGQGKKDDASFYYASVVKNFPKSAKAGDSLYKVGLILLEKGEKTKAKAVFQQVVSQYASDKKTVALANSKLTELQ
ncbi:tol-pal system protein YbgF [Orbaceae bacterium ac157xtp]